MDTKYTPETQAGTQDVVSPGIWHGMASAPVGVVGACIDIWCKTEERRITDCFFDKEASRWSYETFDGADYRCTGVIEPLAWMPSPAAPEGF